MVTINIVTAVSRPQFLPRILRSLEDGVSGSGLSVNWILVFDSLPHKALQSSKKIEITQKLHSGGPSRFGVMQKNTGLGLLKDGYFYLLDDDNIVHPNFFIGIAHAMKLNPGKKAFSFSQKRWDMPGGRTLTARPENMQPCQIDNSMFVVHKTLVGSSRYDYSKAGIEDFHFFRAIYDKYPQEFVFLDEELAYYNYLKQFPDL